MPSRTTPQAAVIAYRRDGDTLEICLIRRRDTSTWGIPKGLVDPGDTLEQTALNEAWEEAGIRGRLVGDVVGTYEYEKWRTTFAVAVYLMEVHRSADDWLESRIRERRWVLPDRARVLLHEHPVRSILSRALDGLALDGS
jgi:8-oxo-dGTP pyrophosphatase MutT (NUDIX family)